MSSLHGNWILKETTGYLFIWGETWQPLESIETPKKTTQIPLHPYSIPRKDFPVFLDNHNFSLDDFLTVDSPDIKETWETQIMTLPSQKLPRKEIYLPILSSHFQKQPIPESIIELKQWQVSGCRINIFETINLLKAIPLGTLQTGSFIADDLKFLSHLYRWSLDLIARSKFFPGILSDPDGKPRSVWQPLLDSAIDQSRLAKFSKFIPLVCYSYQNDQEIDSHKLIIGFLSSILDAQLRTLINVNTMFNKPTDINIWLQSLSRNLGLIKQENIEFKRLENSLKTWSLPIQENLVNAKDYNLTQNQFRTCFNLVPPMPGEIAWGHLNWKLQFYLQAIDDPEFLIDAETIWQNPVEELEIEDRIIQNPQETFLKGLGLASRLYSPIADSLQEKRPVQSILDPIQVYQFIRSGYWQLQDSGLGVFIPSSLISGTEERRLGIKIKAEIAPVKGARLGLKSLLNYKLEVAIGDQTVSKEDFENLLAQKSPLVQVNGEWMALQPADVRAAQAVLSQSNEEIQLSVEDALRFSTGETKTFVKLPVVSFESSGVLQALINNLTDNQSLELVPTPQEFQGTLRPYQIRGISWLAFLEKWGLGACLADDMGLGKTPQLIAFLLHLKEQKALEKPVLVVCPTSVLNNWEREVKKFAPTLKTLVHHGDKRAKGKEFINEIKNKHLVITSYPLIYRDLKTLDALEWQGIVLDEAQNIKNSQAKQSQAIRQLKADFQIALTGTPVENRLSELWSILDFLNPGFLGNRQFFQRRFAMPIEKYGDQDSLQTLRSLVQPFILRRLKTDKEIVQDLPEKQEMSVFCGLSGEQAKLYQQLVDQSLTVIDEATGIQRRGLILTLLLRLKQLCNHPSLYLKEEELDLGERSGKLLRLEEMLEEVLLEGDHALIFTQFSEWGKLLQPYLEEKLETEVLFLYGSTPREKRQEMIDRFQNDPEGPQIFILSLKAGGTGLNLTRANHVFHVDRWWNPAVENQATDRAFRIGQKRNVQVHKFVCTGTLEERINDMIETKKQLAEQTVDAGEQWLTEMDTDQLRNLLLLDRDSVIDDE
jgi:SNF2 family DNA or RNA helicase